MKNFYFAFILSLMVCFSTTYSQDTTAVEQAAPAVEQAAPAVEQAAPAVEQAAPAVEQAAPAVEQAAPAVEQAAPAEQPSEAVAEEEAAESEKPWAISLNVGKGYLWRGQPLGLPDHLVFQPGFSYQVTPELSIGAWMTKNYNDNNPGQGYDEYDIYASYTVNDFVTVGLASYYFPALGLEAGEENPAWTDFSGEGLQTLDATVTVDLSSKINQPITILWSTFLAGADVADDANQFTSYAEATYSFEIEKFGLSGTGTVGAIVFGNKSAYYTFAKDGFNLVNISGRVSKDVTSMIPFMQHISKSMWGSFTYNPQISDDNETTTYYGSSDGAKIGPALFSLGMQFDF
ncbi:MAG: hypothetical protein O3A55_07700 [Bacteroidetes bacterium]|nr:hypothetical protein [Bacteroidota bacterium]